MKDNFSGAQKPKTKLKKLLSHKTVSMLLAVAMLFSSIPLLSASIAEAVTIATDSANNSVDDDKIDIANYPIVNALDEGEAVSAASPKSSAFTGNCVWTDADRTNTAGETGALVKMYKKAENSYYFYLPQTANLAGLPIFFSGYSSVKIGDNTITSGNTYKFTAGTAYPLTLNGAASGTVTFMQSGSPALYLDLNNTLPAGTNDDAGYTDANGDQVSIEYKDGEIKSKDSGIKYEANGSFAATEDGRGADSYQKGNVSKVTVLPESYASAAFNQDGKYALRIILDKKTKLFANLNKGDDFWLCTNRYDPAFNRDIFTYELAKQLGLDYVPTFECVDLYDKGEYIGSYMITDRIRADEQSVNISDQGYLVQFEYEGAIDATATRGNFEWDRTDQGQSFIVEKMPEGGSVDAIKAKLNAAGALIYDDANGNYKQDDKSFAEINALIDVESFVKVYLINELSKNCDSGERNYYIYYDPAVDERLHAASLREFAPSYGVLNDQRILNFYCPNKEETNKEPIFSNQDLATGWDSRLKNIHFYSNGYYPLHGYGYDFQAQLINNTQVWDFVESYFFKENGFYDITYNMLNGSADTKGTLSYYINKNRGSLSMNESRWGFIENKNDSDMIIYDGSSYDKLNESFRKWTNKRLTWLHGEENIPGQEDANSLFARKGAIKRNDRRELYEIEYNYTDYTYTDSYNRTNTIKGFTGSRYVVYSRAADKDVNFSLYSANLTGNQLNWHGARDFCEQQGGHLATFTSEGEGDTVKNYLVKNREFAFIAGYDQHTYFLEIKSPDELPSVYQYKEQYDDRFRWVTDEPFYDHNDLVLWKWMEYCKNTDGNPTDDSRKYGFSSKDIDDKASGKIGGNDDRAYMATIANVAGWFKANPDANSDLAEENYGVTAGNYGWNVVRYNNYYVRSFIMEVEEHEFTWTDSEGTEHRYALYDSTGEYKLQTVNGESVFVAAKIDNAETRRSGAPWYTCVELARRKGGHLATVTSEDEWNVIKQLLYKNSGVRAWLGGFGTGTPSASTKDNRNRWAWVTGEDWDNTLDGKTWRKNEPSSSSSGVIRLNGLISDGQYYSEIENFIVTYGGDKSNNYEFNDYANDTDLVCSYVCEFETSKTLEWVDNVDGVTSHAADSDATTTGTLEKVKHKYTLYMANMSWYEAQAYCEKKGGHLATFTSEDEWKEVSKKLLNYNPAKSADNKYTTSQDQLLNNTQYNDVYTGKNSDNTYFSFAFDNNSVNGKNNKIEYVGAGAYYYIPTNPGYQLENSTSGNDRQKYTKNWYQTYRGIAANQPRIWLGGYDYDLLNVTGTNRDKYGRPKEDTNSATEHERSWQWITGEVFESYKNGLTWREEGGKKFLQYYADTPAQHLAMATFDSEGGAAYEQYGWIGMNPRANMEKGSIWYHETSVRGFVLETEELVDDNGNTIDKDYKPNEITYNGNKYILVETTKGATSFIDNTGAQQLPSGEGAGYTPAKTWTEVAEECVIKYGAHLATFTTEAEWEVVNKLLARANYPRAWLGGYADNSSGELEKDQIENNKKYWQWLTGEKFPWQGTDGTSGPNQGLTDSFNIEKLWHRTTPQPDFNASGNEFFLTTEEGAKNTNRMLGCYWLNDARWYDPTCPVVAAVYEVEGADLNCGEGGYATASTKPLISNSPANNKLVFANGIANESVSNSSIADYRNCTFNFRGTYYEGDEAHPSDFAQNYKEFVTFTATPDKGNRFHHWEVISGTAKIDGTEIISKGYKISKDTIAVSEADRDFEIKAFFTKTYDVFPSLNPKSASGTVSYKYGDTAYEILRQTDDPNPTLRAYAQGESVTVKFKTGYNYMIATDDVVITGVSASKTAPHQTVTFIMPANDVDIVVTPTDVTGVYDDDFYKTVNTTDGSIPATSKEDRFTYWLETGLGNNQVASPVFDIAYFKAKNAGISDNYNAVKAFVTTKNYSDGALIFDAESYKDQNGLSMTNREAVEK